MTGPEFWGATWRELGARRKVFESARRYTAEMQASILAALHNGPMTRKDEAMWTPDMFLPDQKPQGSDESWRKVKATALAARKMTAEERQRVYDSSRTFDHRQSQAAALQASGGTREQVIALMEGR